MLDSRFHFSAVLIVLCSLTSSLTLAEDSARVLRVCADPNNLPFSNYREEGFENQIASLIAKELDADLEYTWWAQRRGFVRNTLREGRCDLIMGVPSNYELVLTTTPYYRSTYVFLSRRDRNLQIRSLDDSILRKLRIGVHVIGDDYSNTPPAHSLARRKIINNVVGYSIYGDYSKANPPADIINAVIGNEIDLAIVWGPLAGYFARHSPVPLEMVPVSPTLDFALLPMIYDISMGTRRSDERLRDEVEEILRRRRGEIEGILREYGLPQVDKEGNK